MRRAVPAILVVLMAAPVAAQETPQATDVTSADIQTFINALPRDPDHLLVFTDDRALRYCGSHSAKS